MTDSAVEKPPESAPTGDALAKTLIGQFAERYNIGTAKVMGILRDSVFKVSKGEQAFSDEEIAVALILSNLYELNPFAKEIYMTRSKQAGLLVIVGVDGWIQMLQRQPDYLGCRFDFTYQDGEGGKRRMPYSCTCTIRREKGETQVSEYFTECSRDTIPWTSHPHRMLRWKALIQCARVAYGLVRVRGATVIHTVVDPDEAESIRDVPSRPAQRPRHELPAPSPLDIRETSTRREPEPAATTTGDDDARQGELDLGGNPTASTTTELREAWDALRKELTPQDFVTVREATGIERLNPEKLSDAELRDVLTAAENARKLRR